MSYPEEIDIAFRAYWKVNNFRGLKGGEQHAFRAGYLAAHAVSHRYELAQMIDPEAFPAWAKTSDGMPERRAEAFAKADQVISAIAGGRP